MSDRFSVNEIYICPINILSSTVITPDLENFPTRLCVIDRYLGIAIDVEQELKYDYLETISGLYFVNSVVDKIKKNERIAILPLKLLVLDKDKKNKVEMIIERLRNGESFPDGNKILNNEEYLLIINDEKTSNKNIKKNKILRKKVN